MDDQFSGTGVKCLGARWKRTPSESVTTATSGTTAAASFSATSVVLPAIRTRELFTEAKAARRFRPYDVTRTLNFDRLALSTDKPANCRCEQLQASSETSRRSPFELRRAKPRSGVLRPQRFFPNTRGGLLRKARLIVGDSASKPLPLVEAEYGASSSEAAVVSASPSRGAGYRQGSSSSDRNRQPLARTEVPRGRGIESKHNAIRLWRRSESPTASDEDDDKVLTQLPTRSTPPSTVGLNGAQQKDRQLPRACSQEAKLNELASESLLVDELACYFEEYLYLPKKMSLMAEMMYT